MLGDLPWGSHCRPRRADRAPLPDDRTRWAADTAPMLSEEQIDQLAAFDGQGARVLSVYLDLDPATQVRRSYKIALEDLVKTARARLDDASAREAFETEAARVQTWLDSEKPRGKGLAVFSCSPRNLSRAAFLAAPA